MKIKDRMLALVFALVNLLIVVVLLTGCEGEGPVVTISPATFTNMPTPTPTVVLPNNSSSNSGSLSARTNSADAVYPLTQKTKDDNFIELLSLIPASQDFEYLTLVNYSAFQKDFQIKVTDSMTPQEYLGVLINSTKSPQIISQLIDAGSGITGYGPFFPQLNTKQHLGYNIYDTAAEIKMMSTRPLYTSHLIGAIGSYDQQAAIKALQDENGWPVLAKDSYTTENYQGIIINSWGPNAYGLDEFGPLRQTLPLAVSSKNLFCAETVSGVRSMIDASQKRRKNLADNDQFAAVARELSKSSDYIALMGDVSIVPNDLSSTIKQGLTDAQYHESMKLQEPKLKHFLAFGSGLGKDDKGTYMNLILVHAEAKDVDANVVLLKERIENTNETLSNRPWNSYFTGGEIKADGNILIAKLYVNFASMWGYWFGTGQLLLYHE
jgi:hypothetical protein